MARYIGNGSLYRYMFHMCVVCVCLCVFVCVCVWGSDVPPGLEASKGTKQASTPPRLLLTSGRPLRGAAPMHLQGKPAPDVYLEAMRRMGGLADPSRALIVEDAVNGLHAAKAAGAQAACGRPLVACGVRAPCLLMGL